MLTRILVFRDVRLPACGLEVPGREQSVLKLADLSVETVQLGIGADEACRA